MKKQSLPLPAIAGLILIELVLLWALPLQARPVQQQDAILKAYVSPAGVDYQRLQLEGRLASALRELEEAPPAADSQARLAYWLNVYNFYTLKLITDNYPIESITDLHLFGSVILGYLFDRTVWQTWHFQLAGKQYTLDQVEHQIVRPRFQDYRVHAALVCAARSCPPLRPEAYRAATLDAQLDDQMRLWLADQTKNRYDADSNTLYLSAIFQWFHDDFTENGKKDLLSVVQAYLPPQTRQLLRQQNSPPEIRFLDYDWSLNDSSLAAAQIRRPAGLSPLRVGLASLHRKRALDAWHQPPFVFAHSTAAYPGEYVPPRRPHPATNPAGFPAGCPAEKEQPHWPIPGQPASSWRDCSHSTTIPAESNRQSTAPG